MKLMSVEINETFKFAEETKWIHKYYRAMVLNLFFSISLRY